VNIGDNLVYVTRNSQSLRGMVFSAESESFIPVDVTLLAKHIFKRTKTITTMAYQQDRQQILWVTLDDGTLVAVTYVPEQRVFAWHRHFMGGSFSGSDSVVDCIAVIPSKDEVYDQPWMIVKRTVDGATTRQIEFLEDEWLDGVAVNMRYIDSAPLAYSGSATNTFDGLDHLVGETVQVLADGAAHPDRVVDGNGQITLDAEYSDVIAGLGYVSTLETLSLEPEDPEGASLGKVARIDHLIIRFHETVGGKLGKSTSELDPIVFRSSSDDMNEPVPAFTGDKKIAFRGGFVREKVFVVVQDQPLPFNMLSVNVLMSTGAR